MRKFFSAAPIQQITILAIVRVITGLLMIYHGWEVFDPVAMKAYLPWDSFKGFSSPELVVYTGKAAELLAGVLLVIGLFTRIAALILIFSMLYISFGIGHGKIWYEDQHPFLFVLLGLVFLFVGGGPYSLDHRIFNYSKSRSNA